jgi:hypothetical protein
VGLAKGSAVVGAVAVVVAAVEGVAGVAVHMMRRTICTWST